MSLPASSPPPLPSHRASSDPSDPSRAPASGLAGFHLVASEPAGLVARMTLRRANDTVELGLARGAGRRTEVLEAAFDAGSAAVVARIDREATEGGRSVAAARELTVRLRHNHVAGDIGVLVLEWAPDGDARSGGTATDVVRRAPDGFWRYAVPIPFAAPG